MRTQTKCPRLQVDANDFGFSNLWAEQAWFQGLDELAEKKGRLPERATLQRPRGSRLRETGDLGGGLSCSQHCPTTDLFELFPALELAPARGLIRVSITCAMTAGNVLSMITRSSQRDIFSV